MHTGIDFRMPLRGLRHAVERIDLRKDHSQSSAVPQCLKEHIRTRLAQRALRFLPDPLRHQRIDLT